MLKDRAKRFLKILIKATFIHCLPSFKNYSATKYEIKHHKMDNLLCAIVVVSTFKL